MKARPGNGIGTRISLGRSYTNPEDRREKRDRPLYVNKYTRPAAEKINPLRLEPIGLVRILCKETLSMQGSRPRRSPICRWERETARRKGTGAPGHCQSR